MVIFVRFVKTKKTKRRNGLPHTTKVVCICPNDFMKISVIIPLHNSEETIGECLNAVYNSDYKNYEVIVVDDCSSDDSVKITKKFPCKVIRLDVNRGAAFTRNTGAKVAKGQILVFIDSDIVLKRNSLTLIAGALKSPKISAVTGSFSKDSRYKNFTSQYKNLYVCYSYKYKPHYNSVFFTSIASIRRDIFNKLGGFDMHYKGASAEDVEFGLGIGAVAWASKACCNRAS